MVIFLIMYIVITLFAFLSEKTNKKFYLILTIVAATLLSGLRGITVGIDTAHYYDIFESIIMGKDIYINEESFITISEFLLNIFKRPEYLIFIFSAIINACIIIRLWTFRKKMSFTLMCFFYLGCYFTASLNIMRQFIACSIIFLATLFLENKRYLLYVLAVYIASLFHSSSWLALIILFFFLYKNSTAASRIFITLGFLIVIPFLINVAQDIFEIYEDYFDETTGNIGLLLFVKVFILLIYILLNIKNLNKESIMILIIYGIGIMFTFLGYFYTYMDRVGLSFMLFEIPAWGYMSKKGQFRNYFKTIFILLACYLIMDNIINDGHDIFPYVFIWDDIYF